MRGRALANCPVAQQEEWASAVSVDLVFSSFCVSSSAQAAWFSYVDVAAVAAAADCVCCHHLAGNYPATDIYVQLTTNSVRCKHMPSKVIKISWVVSHHFLGMFVTKRCLVSDVKNRNGALLSISEPCRATGEQLLRAIQQDICINMLSGI